MLARSIDAASARRTRGSSSGAWVVLIATPATIASGTVRKASVVEWPSAARWAGETRFHSSPPLSSSVKFVPGSGTIRTSMRATRGAPRQYVEFAS